jgi:hypothetical protein
MTRGLSLNGLGHLTRRLTAIAPDTATNIERIRHWTREGLLVPIANLHRGTGKHRRYGNEAAYDAAVLMVLAETGLNVISLPYVRKALRLARTARARWMKDRNAPLFMVIAYDLAPGRAATVGVWLETRCRVGIVPIRPSAKVSLIINLTYLYANVQR